MIPDGLYSVNGRTKTSTTRTILPPKEAAKSRPDNGSLLIASGCALVIHTSTLIVRLGVGHQKKGICPRSVGNDSSYSRRRVYAEQRMP